MSDAKFEEAMVDAKALVASSGRAHHMLAKNALMEDLTALAAAHADVVAELEEAKAAILRTANALQKEYEYVLAADVSDRKDEGIRQAAVTAARALTGTSEQDSPWERIVQLTGRGIMEATDEAGTD